MKLFKIAYLTCFCSIFIIGCKSENINESCYYFNNKYPPKNISTNSENSNLRLDVLNEILNKENCLDAYLERGDVYCNDNNFSKAINDYRKVLLIDSLNTSALYKIGFVYQNMKKDDSAILYFTKAINSKTHDGVIVDRQDGLAGQTTKYGKYDIKYNMITFDLGVSYYYLDSLRLALVCFNQCINSNYFPSDSYFYRGAIYLQLTNYKQACNDFFLAKEHGNNEAIIYINKHCK